MNRAAITAKVRDEIVNLLEVDIEDVKDDANLRDDLGADSLDQIELVMKFEKEFDITIPDSDLKEVITLTQCVDLIERLA